MEDLAATTNHSVTITNLETRTKYYFVIKEVINSQEVSSEVFDFESDYNYAVALAPAVPSPYPTDSMTSVYASVAQGILDNTGLVRGYCLDYGCGDGRLAYELALRSDLNIIGVAEDAATVARARQALQAAGLYGSRVTIIQSPLAKLPHMLASFLAMEPLTPAGFTLSWRGVLAAAVTLALIAAARRRRSPAGLLGAALLVAPLAPLSTGAALVQAPGVTPVSSGPMQERPRLRGLDSTRLLILVDGERLNNARTATDRSATEVRLVDLNAVERIEVVGGSGSVMYGTDALAGTINIITNSPGSRTA